MESSNESNGQTISARAAETRPPAGKTDGRREPRYLPSKMVEILPCRGRKDWEFLPAEIVDCSAGGVGLSVSERLGAGEQFILKLKLAKWMLLLYTVRYCEPIPGSRAGGAQRFRVGAELAGHVDASSHHDPQAILSALIAEYGNTAR